MAFEQMTQKGTSATTNFTVEEVVRSIKEDVDVALQTRPCKETWHAMRDVSYRRPVRDQVSAMVQKCLKLLAHCQCGRCLADFVADVQYVVKRVLFLLLRRYNKTSSPWARLPLEIWYLIWQDFSFPDRIAFSHVCDEWRVLALTSPSLWTRIDLGEWLSYINIFDPSSRRPYGDHWLNWKYLPLVSEVLLRSQPFLLRVEIRTPFDYYSVHTVQFLSRCFYGHAERVRDLEIHCSRDPLTLIPYDLPRDFFFSIRRLPALRTLTIADGDEYNPINWLDSTIDFPALKSLDLSPSFYWCSHTDLHFPSLVTLSASFASSADITHALTACPLLSSLHIRHQFDEELENEVDPGLPQRFSRIQTLCLSNATPALEHWYCTEFRHDLQQKVLVNFSAEVDIPALKLSLFSVFKGRVRLSITTEDERIVFSVTDLSKLLLRETSFTLQDAPAAIEVMSRRIHLHIADFYVATSLQHLIENIQWQSV